MFSTGDDVTNPATADAHVRQSIVNNLAALVERRVSRRKGGRRTQVDDAIAAIARGIANGDY